MLRWKEEHQLVKREMDWAVAYFEYQAKQTAAWGDDIEQTPSQLAWASRRSAIWTLLKEHASKVFDRAREKLDKYIAATAPETHHAEEDLRDQLPANLNDREHGSSVSDQDSGMDYEMDPGTDHEMDPETDYEMDSWIGGGSSTDDE